MSKDKPLALVLVGHTDDAEGARNVKTGLTEYQYNTTLADLIARHVQACDVQVARRDGIRYKDLPDHVNRLAPDLVIELHANACGGCGARGTETLYHWRNKQGEILATYVHAAMCQAMNRDGSSRGAKACTSQDRGGHLLAGVEAACIIAEPFFIDSDIDADLGVEQRRHLAVEIAKAIEDYACHHLGASRVVEIPDVEPAHLQDL